MQTEISESDRKAYARQEIMSVMANAMAEAFRQGLGGQTYEARLLYLPWGFRLEDIHHERIYLWHGEQDRNIPSSTGHAIAQAIPNCEAVFYPDDGHLSIIVDHASEILSCLVS